MIKTKSSRRQKAAEFQLLTCGAPTISGQPRFSKSHALITLPSVKNCAEGGRRVWARMTHIQPMRSRVGEGHSEQQGQAPHTPLPGFFFSNEPSVSLKNYHKAGTYTVTMNLCKILRMCMHEWGAGEGGRDRVIKSSHFGTFVSSQ